MTVSPKFSWTFLLLLSFSCVISSQKCRWFQRKNENVINKILEIFNKMIPENESPGACFNNIIVLPKTDHLYQISQVESAALTARDLSNHIIQFYTKNQKVLGWNQEIWDKLKALLYYQETQLSDCISDTADTTESHLFAKGISQHFNRLEKIIQSQHNTMCAQRIIHSEIGRSLRMASQLSSRMRSQQPVTVPQ